MLPLGEGLGSDLGDRAVGAVVVVHELAVDVELGAVVRGGLEGVFLLCLDIQDRLHQEGEMVERLVDAHKVEIILHTHLVRLPEGGEVRQLALWPVKVQLIIDNGLFLGPASGQNQSEGRRKEGFLQHIH